ncbi:MAG: fumarylacetoacetate hydrolase family protein [Hyphomicrobiales bacterium]|nr:fumarylacetoacetate hydrolase family protein [Hyphomicrobiales bacterium]
MRLMSFRRADGKTSWGIADGTQVMDCGALAPRLPPSLRAALASGKIADARNVEALLADARGAPRHALDAVTFLPPIPDPDKIICVGLNYLTHIREGGRDVPKQPTIFTRFANTQVGHMQALIRPSASETLDFEGEMAVVIAKRCRHVKRVDAPAVVAGYSCYNDGSVREWQRHTSQFTPGKNFPCTGGFGPWITTPDEVGDIADSTLTTRVNGEETQRATIDDLVFDVPALIEYCSTFTILEPGDVIITGTTGGVGAYRKPPLWLKPGDVVEVEVSSVGVLRNFVVQEGAPST